MYFSLILENESGDKIDMTTTANRYMITSIEGLNPPAGTVSTSTYAGMNGSYLNNASIEKRNLVISFAMRGTHIETRRHDLYRVVKPSRYIKVYYKTSGIDVYTEGYRIGFINTGKDLSKKSTVNIRYTLGFERVVRIAIENFRKMGLEPVIYRAASGVITKREHHKIGYHGAVANWQS